MTFNFLAKALDDGIVFTYNNSTKAIKVFREGNEIKEEEYCEERQISGAESLELLLKSFRLLILIAIDILIVKVTKHPIVNLWTLYVIAVVLYLTYVIRKTRKEQKRFSYRLKQYHAAEHMIYNVNTNDVTDITLNSLKKESMYADNCGSNMIIVDALNFIFIGIASNIFGYSLLTYEGFIPIILSMMMFCLFVIAIQTVIIYLLNEGVFNHIIQPKVLAEPTDEQLELAIYGMKRVRELEKKSN